MNQFVYNGILPTQTRANVWEEQVKQELRGTESAIAFKKYGVLAPLQQFYFDAVFRPFSLLCSQALDEPPASKLADLEEFIEKVAPKISC
jgi:hypothetical protein